jgi:pimeloyl-ACP methyl ester carboxylesterase
VVADLTSFLAAYDAVVDRWPVAVDRLELASEYGTTHVIACGPPSGSPLVLLHGHGATAAVWFANVADLSRTRRVYAVDRIGEAGRSVPGDRRIQSVDDLLDWLSGVLDGLNLDQADLCGHSYGTWLGLQYALRHQGRVRKLVLLDPTACFAWYRVSYLLHAAPVLIRPTAPRARTFLAWETGGAEIDAAWVDLYGRAAEFPGRRPITGKRPAAPKLANLAIPALVLLAADSRAHDVRRVEAAARRQLPNAQTAILPGVSHHGMPSLRAAELDGQILSFLDQS